MVTKPIRKEPYPYYGSEIWENGHPTGKRLYEKNPKWMYSDSDVWFNTKSEALNAWDSFSVAWDRCARNADMINLCKQIEYTVAALYGMFEGMKDSYIFTKDNLQSAIDQTTSKKKISESNLEYVNGQISSLLEVVIDEAENDIVPSIDLLNDMNEKLKEVGDEITGFHKVIYKTYKECCRNVGVEIQNFYSEVEV